MLHAEEGSMPVAEGGGGHFPGLAPFNAQGEVTGLLHEASGLEANSNANSPAAGPMSSRAVVTYDPIAGESHRLEGSTAPPGKVAAVTFWKWAGIS